MNGNYRFRPILEILVSADISAWIPTEISVLNVAKCFIQSNFVLKIEIVSLKSLYTTNQDIKT